jgi:amidophosphoribosyltransferase
MAGLLALLFFEAGWDTGDFIRYGLESLSHRGEYGTVCFRAGGRVKCVEYTGRMSDVGDSAVAAWLDSSSRDLQVAEGEFLALICDRPSKHVGEVADVLEKALASTRTHVELPKLLGELAGVDIPSFVALSSRGELVAWRSSSGLTPLTVGSYGFDMAVVSSESPAIEALDADVKKHLDPGEGLYMSRRFVRTFRTPPICECGTCLLELLHTARHDSIVDGVSVYEFRKALGWELGKYLRSQVDAVVGIPEAAIPYAVGLSQCTGAKFEVGFVAGARSARSLLKRDIRNKVAIAHLKLNPVGRALEGRRVAVVDNMVVTGYTLKTASQILRYRVGVSELHALIASPKIVRPCPYGVVGLDAESLIAAHLDSKSIERFLEVDSLTWLGEDDLERVARSFRLKLCGKCLGKDTLGGG